MVVVCTWYKYMILKLKFVFSLFQTFSYSANTLKNFKCDILRTCILLCEIWMVISCFQEVLGREIFDIFLPVLGYPWWTPVELPRHHDTAQNLLIDFTCVNFKLNFVSGVAFFLVFLAYRLGYLRFWPTEKFTERNPFEIWFLTTSGGKKSNIGLKWFHC